MKKYSRFSKCIVLVLTLFFYAHLLVAQIPAQPKPPRLVNDFSNTLSADEQMQLERKLVNYNDTTSTQILVVLVSDLAGYDEADFAFRLGEQWGVGQKGSNNGVVILVKPKTDRERGKAFIASGYGLEGVIPDALAKRVVEQEMIPAFKNDDYFEGLWLGTDAIIGLASGLYAADRYDQSQGAAWFIPILVLVIVFFMMRAGRSANHINSKGSNLPFWTALFLASQSGRSHSGSWRNFSGGSGGFGGGGSGFGGFGGGSFGGGGAGGSW
ncbi:MAG: TPM domain-containing protein [Bacteroidales bacterium]|nr:TPM domain-containing protein [Bacteroidales bacterium]